MQQVIIIPLADWNAYQANQEQLLKRLERIERSQASWIRTPEATILTGKSRKELEGARKVGALEYGTHWKKEGERKVLYNRLALEAWNDSHKPRRRSLN